MPVEASDVAKVLVEFQYGEIKDLAKAFLTVVAAVLTLSIAFSEKIVNFNSASVHLRVLMAGSWCLCLLAFVLGGAAIFLLYNAGVSAKYFQFTKSEDFMWLLKYTHLLLIGAGSSFVAALGLLVIVGLVRIKWQ